MNWYIGQEIVCIKSNPERSVKEGQEFKIQGLRAGCCGILIDVGIKTDATVQYCLMCGKNSKKRSGENSWYSETRFAPKETMTQAETAVKELLQPIEIKIC